MKRFLKPLGLLLFLFFLGGPMARVSAQSDTVPLTFSNRTDITLELNWKDRRGNLTPYSVIAPGRSHRQPSYPGNLWVLTSKRTGEEVRVLETPRKATTVVVRQEDLRRLRGPQAPPPQYEDPHQHSGHTTSRAVDLTFSNRSAHELSVYYRLPSSRRNTFHAKVPRDRSLTVRSERGVEWFVQDGRELVKSCTAGSRSETIEITEEDLHGHGSSNDFGFGSGVSVLTVANRSHHPIDLFSVERGRPKLVQTIPAERSVEVRTTNGAEWWIGNPEAKNYLRRLTITRREQREVVTEKDYHHPEHAYDQTDRTAFNLLIENKTGNTITILRPRRGPRRQKEITIRPWTTERIFAREGAELTVVDETNRQTLKTIQVTARDPRIVITEKSLPTVSIRVANYRNRSVDLYLGRETVRSNYKRRVSPGRTYRLNARVGQNVTIVDSRTGQALKSFSASSDIGDVILSDRGGIDIQRHDHGGHDHHADPHHDHAEGPYQTPTTTPRPSRSPNFFDILRDIFGGSRSGTRSI